MYITSNNYSMNDYLYFDGLSDYDIMIGALDKDDDTLDGKSTAKYIGKRKTGRAYRRSSGKKKNNRMKSIASGVGRHAVPTVWLNWRLINGEWTQVGKYVKHSNSSSRQKCFKRCSNKKVRQSDDIFGKGNAYRRGLDCKWKAY